jgi:methylmalonyl-CoA/ethylmalonyl-CoA epimerase
VNPPKPDDVPEPNAEQAHPTVLSETLLSNSFLGKLIEVCIVTADHRRTMEGLVRLGIGPWKVYTFDSSTVTEMSYGGEPADYAIKVCFAEMDNVTFEIMQPLRGPTIFDEFLRTHGEGIHHIAFDCEDRPWHERITAFADRGFRLIQSGRFADRNPFAFFDTAGATTTTFETYTFGESFSWPEPEDWFPAAPPPLPPRPDLDL